MRPPRCSSRLGSPSPRQRRLSTRQSPQPFSFGPFPSLLGLPGSLPQPPSLSLLFSPPSLLSLPLQSPKSFSLLSSPKFINLFPQPPKSLTLYSQLPKSLSLFPCPLSPASLLVSSLSAPLVPGHCTWPVPLPHLPLPLGLNPTLLLFPRPTHPHLFLLRPSPLDTPSPPPLSPAIIDPWPQTYVGLRTTGGGELLLTLTGSLAPWPWLLVSCLREVLL